MSVDLPRFYQACTPTRPLEVANPVDRPYFINFSPVRGGDIVMEIGRAITHLSNGQPTTQLFTGHVGCGKSTELFRLKDSLEHQGYHVVYFLSDQDLDMANVEVTNVLLVIARQVSESLEQVGISLRPPYFQRLLQDITQVLRSPIAISDVSLSAGIASVTAEVKESADLRSQLQNFLEPRTRSIIDAVNNELLIPAIARLKSSGKQGLAVIVDNLDRMDSIRYIADRLQSEHLFINRGDQLRRLACHVVYTIPLELVFSNDLPQLVNRFGNRPKMLPMVPVQTRQGDWYEPGLALLRQMVLARALPDQSPEERLERLTEVFEDAATLDRLCTMSGGHVRNLMRFLFGCLSKQDPPFSRAIVEAVIQEERDDLSGLISPNEWTLLLQAVKEGSLQSEEDYNVLLRSLFLFEYRPPNDNRWFGINPVLMETEPYRRWRSQQAIP